MSNEIWVYIEFYNGEISVSSLEALSAAQHLALHTDSRIVTISIGFGIDKYSDPLISYRINEIVFLNNPALSNYILENYLSNIERLIELRGCPNYFLFSQSSISLEIAATLSLLLKTNIITGVRDINTLNNEIIYTTSIFLGKFSLDEKLLYKPHIISIYPHSFPKAQKVSNQDPPLISLITENLVNRPANEDELIIEDIYDLPKNSVIFDSNIVVSGGKGIMSPLSNTDMGTIETVENYGLSLIFRLSEILRGTVGASRAIVDGGFISYDHQVGLSGKIVKPELYIACGISGSFQHLIGMKNSRVIVAINPNRNAPIFDYAHIGIVGDLFEILPAIIQTLEEHFREI